MTSRLSLASAALGVALLITTGSASAGGPRPHVEPYGGCPGDPYAACAVKPEKYGAAWHRPHRWPGHRPPGIYVGVPTYPYWRVPAVDRDPTDVIEPVCRWERVYGVYRNHLGRVVEGWHKIPVCS